MEYARGNVFEGAAGPKGVYIIPEMPVTLVGKIFKPKLRWDGTRRAYEEAPVPWLHATRI